MRPGQTIQSPEGAVDYNSGINMLPGYGSSGVEGFTSPDDYPALTGGPQFVPPPQPSFTSRATPASSGGYPIPGQAESWRGSATGPSAAYPAPGTPYFGAPAELRPGFFGRLLDSFGNLAGGVTGAVGGLAGGIGSLAGDIGGLAGGMEDLSSGLGGFFDRMRKAAPRPAPFYNMAGFNSTAAQMSFPGLSIGPTSGRVTNPYQAGTTLGGRQPLGGPPPAGAMTFMNAVRARNIA